MPIPSRDGSLGGRRLGAPAATSPTPTPCSRPRRAGRDRAAAARPARRRRASVPVPSGMPLSAPTAGAARPNAPPSTRAGGHAGRPTGCGHAGPLVGRASWRSRAELDDGRPRTRPARARRPGRQRAARCARHPGGHRRGAVLAAGAVGRGGLRPRRGPVARGRPGRAGSLGGRRAAAGDAAGGPVPAAQRRPRRAVPLEPLPGLLLDPPALLVTRARGVEAV